ncbi:hypothetical protein E2C01_099034 [Portunus trituberculatus]|uniref:Uncharacterized protein n=1 Tax=Portunus trituberculatus TaxID=210409 RepID=A0A5B7K984_PORTR|nr:hypothetical protein [Portunus trituberculatus]
MLTTLEKHKRQRGWRGTVAACVPLPSPGGQLLQHQLGPLFTHPRKTPRGPSEQSSLVMTQIISAPIPGKVNNDAATSTSSILPSGLICYRKANKVQGFG